MLKLLFGDASARSPFEDGGNPPEDDGKGLCFRHQGYCIVEEVSAATVQSVLVKRKKWCNEFIAERLVQRTKPITNPVHWNRRYLFYRPQKAQKAVAVLFYPDLTSHTRPDKGI